MIRAATRCIAAAVAVACIGSSTTPGSVAAAPASASRALPADTPVDVSVPGWVALENQKAGTSDWRIAGANTSSGLIEGYARTTSAMLGDVVTLHVNTTAPEYSVAAYRMGYYGGTYARLVWTSGTQTGTAQPAAVFNRRNGMVEARWSPSLSISIDAEWLPGNYLLKLTSSENHQRYIPLTVRHPGTSAQLMVVNAVSTWQAYNRWGGCSRYQCLGRLKVGRAAKSSFDRPYMWSLGYGSGGFLKGELPMVAFIEELGIDAVYVTSIDLHAQPGIAQSVKGIVSLGHDEYYSSDMRRALVDARGAGVNLAFFGANAIYRRVNFESATDGAVLRVMADAPQPTGPPLFWRPWNGRTEWRKMQKPEHALVGVGYLCNRVNRPLVVRNPNHWIWKGSGVRRGTRLENLIAIEADGLSVWSPRNIDVIGSSPIRCGVVDRIASTTYYSHPSRAGVFASGTIAWICGLWAVGCSKAANIPVVRRATENVLRVFAAGPAGVVHPSSGRR